jgi:hypothetical protein
LNSNDSDTHVIALPFVLFRNGKYEEIPRCGPAKNTSQNAEQQAIEECNLSKSLFQPILSSGNLLYKVQEDIKENVANTLENQITIEKVLDFGYSDWVTSVAMISSNPNCNFLINKPNISRSAYLEPANKPKLETRESQNGDKFEDKLLGKFDFDGDNIPEFIYSSDDSEGSYFQIYSLKDNVWIKVFNGGYQGY